MPQAANCKEEQGEGRRSQLTRKFCTTKPISGEERQNGLHQLWKMPREATSLQCSGTYTVLKYFFKINKINPTLFNVHVRCSNFSLLLARTYLPAVHWRALLGPDEPARQPPGDAGGRVAHAEDALEDGAADQAQRERAAGVVHDAPGAGEEKRER